MDRKRYAKLFNQDRYWIDADGDRIAFTSLNGGHRANLIPFLRGNARTYFLLANERDAVDLAEAEEWLAATPLMVRLCELEARRPIDERRAIHEANEAYEHATGYQKVRLG